MSSRKSNASAPAEKPARTSQQTPAEKPARTSAQTPAEKPARKFPWIVAVAVLIAVAIGSFLAFRGRGYGSGDPDIILVTIDTLRADAVSADKTPFLFELAKQGLSFENAHAHNVVTLPSHTNILTGLLPYQHGVRDNAGFTLDNKP